MSDLRLVALCCVSGVVLGVGSVFALTWGDSYERIDSLIGTSGMGLVAGLVVGVVAVAVRAGLRSLRGNSE
ncbi:hypothetical protein [Phycicoccus sp. Soil803]|uniref:hypothetical protein n=1 Tax=Phycicoccus sp. Soil803 TaxID=1736415 RepID=UPI00070E375C|nr:hypothetical protein [Phycicoccus sp. Soil803]KRF25021.1 hypothetical protein ASG95_11290 [Phycicoccus sp. Soil803]